MTTAEKEERLRELYEQGEAGGAALVAYAQRYAPALRRLAEESRAKTAPLLEQIAERRGGLLELARVATAKLAAEFSKCPRLPR